MDSFDRIDKSYDYVSEWLVRAANDAKDILFDIYDTLEEEDYAKMTMRIDRNERGGFVISYNRGGEVIDLDNETPDVVVDTVANLFYSLSQASY